MIVSAKINLQNAADLAAYAGASTQARQMTHISYLNYELRRQYKKFLFRYYIMGNYSKQSFTAISSRALGQRYHFELNQMPGAPNVPALEVPVICFDFGESSCSDSFRLSLAPNSNFTRYLTPGVTDPIFEAFSRQAEFLNRELQTRCSRRGGFNKNALLFWLYNSDPKLVEFDRVIAAIRRELGDNVNCKLESAITDPEKKDLCTTLNWYDNFRGLVTDIGLIPRNTILAYRIRTLAKMINFPAQKQLNFARVQGLKNSIDPLMKERSIAAFMTAFENLGAGAFANDPENDHELKMTELLPEGDQPLIELEEKGIDFSAYYADFETQSAGNTACAQVPVPTKVRNVPILFVKSPSKLVYYALQLKANVRLMFSPFGNLELTAYAAAQPFGSRIGPAFDASEYTTRACPENFFTNVGAGRVNTALCREHPTIPNIKLTPGDEHGLLDGFALKTIFGRMPGDTLPNQRGQPRRQYGNSDFNMGETILMGPLKSEFGRFSIPANTTFITPPERGQSTDTFPSTFYEHPMTVANRTAPQQISSFWAPIMSPEDPSYGQIEQELGARIDELIGNQRQAARTFGDPLKRALTQYLTDIRTGQRGEDNESFTIASLQDPMSFADLRQQKTRQLLESNVAIPEFHPSRSDLSKVFSSWNTPDQTFRNREPRSSYSVKLISFPYLLGRIGGGTTDRSALWQNRPGVDNETARDLEELQH